MLEFCVTKLLPEPNQVVLCFGYSFCPISECVEKNPEWHKVTFCFEITSYRLKTSIPLDLNESILEENYGMQEVWKIKGCSGCVIGVTKWIDLDSEDDDEY